MYFCNYSEWDYKQQPIGPQQPYQLVLIFPNVNKVN